MISPQLAPEYAYYTGREYAERYEPRYGTGLVLASVPMLEDIVQFWHQYYDLKRQKKKGDVFWPSERTDHPENGSKY